MLTKREREVKMTMEEQFIPALHKILSTQNPQAYATWGGNACRQTAILGAKLLEELLPEYKWEAWDADFNDIILGRPTAYNHAWIYGMHKTEERKLLVDLSRNFQERLFMVTEVNEYPKDHPEYQHMETIRKTKLNLKKMIKEHEYFTSLKGVDLYKLVKKEMR